VHLSSACICDLLYTVQHERGSELQPLTTLCVVVQASYILVKGGSLQIGREDAPFPSAAKITLYGPPDSRELPLYGAKVSVGFLCLISTNVLGIFRKNTVAGLHLVRNMPTLCIGWHLCQLSPHTRVVGLLMRSSIMRLA
jgi:hypothetical protein